VETKAKVILATDVLDAKELDDDVLREYKGTAVY